MDPKDHLVPTTPCHGQGHHYTRLLKALSLPYPGLEHRCDWGIYYLPRLQDIFQCLTALTEKNFFLISILNQSSCSLRPSSWHHIDQEFTCQYSDRFVIITLLIQRPRVPQSLGLSPAVAASARWGQSKKAWLLLPPSYSLSLHLFLGGTFWTRIGLDYQ